MSKFLSYRLLFWSGLKISVEGYEMQGPDSVWD